MNIDNWDWQPGKKEIADIGQIRKKFPRVDELTVSPDGEKIAALVKPEEGDFTAYVNGEAWPIGIELFWHLRFTPAGKLMGLGRMDDQWTVIIDGQPWEERFEYVWNPKFSADGSAVACLYKRDDAYGVVIDDKPWDQGFQAIRDYCISDDGTQSAATVQVEPVAEADIFGFLKGVWTLAVNGKLWDKKFINIYSPIFNADGSGVAAEIRTDICEYSIAKNGQPWEARYSCVWEPIFRKANGSVIAPVRHSGVWAPAENGHPIWKKRYNQLWQLKFSHDGNRLAAIASPAVGQWTIVVDDVPWPKTWGDMVLEPIFSPDSGRIAAIVKDGNRWTVAVDGKPWEKDFDMIWNPVFSPDSRHLLAKAESGGKYFIINDGKIGRQGYDLIWDPVFSKDSRHVLLRYILGDKYIRQVAPVGEL